MGTYYHKTIICRSNDEMELEAARAAAVMLFEAAFAPDYDGSCLISPIINTGVNSECSFFVAPDGSAVGHEHHQVAEAARQKFIDYLKFLKYDTLVDWALVRFGGDTGADARIVDHNDSYLHN